MKKSLAFILVILMVLLASIIILYPIFRIQKPTFFSPEDIAKHETTIAPSSAIVQPTPSPSSTPKPLTFAQMNAAYGPCAVVPTLMYHHVQDYATAKKQNHASLTVDTPLFRKQMEYLRDHNYSVIDMNTLDAFFDAGSALPKKPVLLTFDDGYADFATDAFPILQEFGYHATLFVPTGLVENSGYLSWNTISSMSSLVTFANHTWSHHTMGANRDVDTKEISLADQQLADRQYNTKKIFAYPYGTSNATAISILNDKGYTLAFTTVHGSILCKKQRLALPRLRIGNAPLQAFGL